MVGRKVVLSSKILFNVTLDPLFLDMQIEKVFQKRVFSLFFFGMGISRVELSNR